MEIITPIQLWQNYSAEINYNSNVLSSYVVDDIRFTNMYVDGYAVGNAVTRVFMVVAQLEGKSCRRSMLYVGQIDEPINTTEMAFWAKKGYTVASIDYTGNCNGKHTIYPSALSYALAGSDDYFIGENVCESKWYNYAYNSMVAVSYLRGLESVRQTTVMSYGSGSHVALMALGVSQLVDNGVILLGNVSKGYNGKVENNEDDVEKMQREQRWIMALAPQSYLPLVKAPLYMVATANSKTVDAFDVGKVHERTNDNSRLLILPSELDYVSNEILDGVCQWTKGITVDEEITISHSITDGKLSVVVTTNGQPLDGLTLWCCGNSGDRCKHWFSVDLTATDIVNCYSGEVEVFEQHGQLLALVVVDDVITISTAITVIPTEGSVISPPSHLVYRGDKCQKLIGIAQNKWHGEGSASTKVNGFLDIEGTKGNTLVTFGIRDSAIAKDIDTITFDLISEQNQQLIVSAVTDFDTNDKYTAVVNVFGDNKWQRITLEASNFKKESGQTLPVGKLVDMIVFSGENITLNNICVV